MNDITALMASMKAAAEKATEAHERLSAMPSDGLFDASLAENAQLESDITALITHNDASTPANVRTLVEALEKREELRASANRVVNQQDIELQELRYRIAELESRTVNPYPLATDKSQGWTIHPDFLHQIGEHISDDEENYDSRPSMEMVEAVLLAAGGINSGAQVGTVTVKLPKRYSCEGYHIDEAYLQEDPEGDCYDRDEVLEALAAAGIQVIEGEA